MIKLITLLKRKSDISHEQFSQYWKNEHGPLVAKVLPGMKKYVQNHIMSTAKGDDPQIDGIAEVWYDDMKSFRATADTYQSNKGKVLRDAEENFIDKSKLVSFVVEENVLIK